MTSDERECDFCKLDEVPVKCFCDECLEKKEQKTRQDIFNEAKRTLSKMFISPSEAKRFTMFLDLVRDNLNYEAGLKTKKEGESGTVPLTEFPHEERGLFEDNDLDSATANFGVTATNHKVKKEW